MTGFGVTHEEVRESLEALALDAIDPPERDALLAHLDGCASCRDALGAMRTTVAELAYAVNPAPMSSVGRDRVRDRLMSRAEPEHGHVAEPRGTPSSSPAILMPDLIPSDPRRPRIDASDFRAGWMLAAASIVAIVSIAALLATRRERDDLTQAVQLASAERFASGLVLDSLRAAVQDREHLVENLTGPQVAVVTLTSNDARSPSARMFWNQPANAWTFVGHSLSAPKPGRVYQIWIVTSKARVSAGTFTPSANGDALVRASYSLARDGLAAVSVTDEPAGGSSQPTTTPFIVGTKATR